MSTDTDKRRIAMMCWKRGTEAMNQQNWDYSIEMFAQATLLTPDNVLYRQSLRGCEYRKYNDNKSGARFAGTKLMTVRGRIKKAMFQQDWVEVDKAAEEGLKINPWDAQLNAAVGEACDRRGFSDSAIFGYTKAVEAEPDNKQFLRSLALLLENKAEYVRARGCWERIAKLDPLDGEARSKMTQLDASNVMKTSGMDDASNTREVADKTAGRAYDEADGKLDKRNRPGVADGPGMSVEADLQRAIRKTPADASLHVKLAQLYLQEKRLNDALTKFREAVQVSGGDPNIRELMEDCELELLRQNAAKAKELANNAPDDATKKQNSSAMASELISREIEVMSARVQRYPTNLQLKYELGRRFMRVKKWTLAIPLLQQASADSRMKAEVLLNLGKCFLQDNKRPLAQRQLEKAAPEISPHDRPDLYCEVHYLLGYLFEDAGDVPKAEHHYTEVLQFDYNFRDARDRLERLQGGTGGGSDGSSDD